MEDKISVSSLAARLAASKGKSKKISEDFIREFFRLISDRLVEGDTVKIKGFGTFKVVERESRMGVNVNTGEPMEIPSGKKIAFIPSKEMADAINLPFEGFETVEIEDDFEDELIEAPSGSLKEEPQEELPEKDPHIELNENEVSLQRMEVGSDEEGDDDEITYEAYHEIEEEKRSAQNSSITSTQPVAEVSPSEVAPDIEPMSYYPEETKSRYRAGFLTGALSTFALCVVIFLLGCFFNWWPVNFGNANEIAKSEAEANQELIAPVPEEESPAEEIQAEEPVYDTVSTTRYLTTIAREHYGNFNFWPYIYIENQQKLGHPDRITPGTQVVVPPLSKYGVNPESKQDIEEAKKKGLEIYARYK